ncbi:MAG: hypothetical protein ACK47B_22430 [Armatimonadota bacterium]
MGIWRIFGGRMVELLRGNVWEILRTVVTRAAADEVEEGLRDQFRALGPEGREELAGTLERIAALLRADRSGRAAGRVAAELVGRLTLR